MDDWMQDFAGYVRELLPEELAEPFIALARPAVRLSRAEEGETVVGRLGGLPRLPEGVPWPGADEGRAMQFLAELDCAAFAAYETDVDLPAEGALLFFSTWDNAAARVILLPPGAVRVPERDVPVSGDARVFPEAPLAARTVATWPTRSHDELVNLGQEFWDRPVEEEPDEDLEEEEAGEESGEPFGDLLAEFADTGGDRVHQVGGYSDALQAPIEVAAAYRVGGLTPKDPGFAAEAAQWVTLLQLDEDNGMIFGDGGILIFGIRRDRLAARDFSQVFPHVQGH
ncbi:YwqG family protein [Nonomuraea fuscirosea]|uniref:YwqG family protein n=1 Tax=Nonomuraea fuscirosea TaxID=1291556 RepID=UPI0033E4B6C3